MEQFKVHPNRLKNLMPGMALIFSPGKEACLARTARAYGVLNRVRLPELVRKVTALEKRLAAMEKSGGQQGDAKG